MALDQNGYRLMPLVAGSRSPGSEPLHEHSPRGLFPGSPSPEAAFAGLWLYFSCIEECHTIVQDLNTPEGNFWHAILHRQEPDPGNAAYWFRRVGAHPIFGPLCAAAEEVLKNYPEAEFRTGGKWDPFSFVMFCERARQQPNTPQEQAALEIQRAEWQLLFDHCARPRP